MIRSSAAVLAVLLGLAVTGCESTSDPGETATIRVQVAGEPEETSVYRAMAADFNRSSDTKVEIVAVAEKSDHLALLQTSFAAGDAPDVYLINFREYSSFVERGAVEPIGPLLEGLDVDLGDYYTPPVEAFTRDGELQCMPQNISSLVVYVNTSVFREAGITPPFDGWTFEEFRRTARALTDARTRGVYVEPSLIRLAPFAWSNGGDVVDDLESPTRLTLGEPRTLEALGLLIALQRSDRVMPTETELAAEDAETMFASGRLAMYLSSRKSTPYFREVEGLEFDVVPLPRIGEQTTILHSDAFCLSPGSGHQDVAVDFIAYATGETGQRLAALGGRTVPSLRSVAESPVFLDPTAQPAHSAVFLDAISGMGRTPVIAAWPEIEDIAEEYLTRAWYDEESDLDELLAELDDRTRPLFRR